MSTDTTTVGDCNYIAEVAKRKIYALEFLYVSLQLSQKYRARCQLFETLYLSQ